VQNRERDSTPSLNLLEHPYTPPVCETDFREPRISGGFVTQRELLHVNASTVTV
jgi:hypothetical protein